MNGDLTPQACLSVARQTSLMPPSPIVCCGFMLNPPAGLSDMNLIIPRRVAAGTSDRKWTLPMGPPMTDPRPTLRKGGFTLSGGTACGRQYQTLACKSGVISEAVGQLFAI